MKTETIIKILVDNLAEYINPVIEGTRYDLAWIIGIIQRETGWLIGKRLDKGREFWDIVNNMLGDSGHGHSIYQIDDRSFPDFCRSGDWKDIEKATVKCIEVLELKRKYIESRGYTEESLGKPLFDRAITSAYNCGEGNVVKALSRENDVDAYTYNHDYSKCVFEFCKIANDIINNEGNTV